MRGDGDAFMKNSLRNKVMGWINDNFDLAEGKINITDYPLFPGGKLLSDKADSKIQMVVYCDILTQEIQVVYPQ